MARVRTKDYTRVVNGRTVKVTGYDREAAAKGAAASTRRTADRPALAAKQGSYGEPTADGRPPIASKAGKFPRDRSVPFPREGA